MTASTARFDGTMASSVSSVPDIKLHHENLDNVFIFGLDSVVDDLFPEEEISFETQPSTAPDTSTIPDNNPVKSSELMRSCPDFHPVGPDDDVLLEYTSVPDIVIDSWNCFDDNLFPIGKGDVNQYYRNNNVIHTSNDDDLRGQHKHPFLALISLWDVLHSFAPDNLTAPTRN